MQVRGIEVIKRVGRIFPLNYRHRVVIENHDPFQAFVDLWQTLDGREPTGDLLIHLAATNEELDGPIHG